jgi:hypothetical protein
MRSPARDERRDARLRLVVGSAGLATAAALVAYVATGLPLGLGLAFSIAVAGAVLSIAWRRLTPAMRTVLKDRARFGCVTGVAATLAYDGARLLVVAGFGLHVAPFAAIPLFGEAIIGGEAAPEVRAAVGVVYHYLNGIAFSVGYMVLFRYRAWPIGVAWALVLEAAMLAIYPGWLAIGALLDEFTLMSMSGHLAFGATLGLLGQYASDDLRFERRRS